MAKLLIEADGGLSQKKTGGEWSVLGLCAHHGHLGMLSTLLTVFDVKVHPRPPSFRS